MDREVIRGAVLLLVVLSGSCASGHRAPFNGPLPQVRDLGGAEARLDRAVAGSAHLCRAVVGEVAYGEYHAPVWKVAFNPGAEARHTVLLLGGIHGNEPAGSETLFRFVETLSRDPGAYGAFAIDVVPILNPWGWVHDQRFNQQGRDINRDFASFRSQEANIVRDCVKGKTYSLIVDLHEDPSGAGFYVYQYANPDTSLSRSIIERERQIGFPIEQDVSMVILRTKDGLIDVPRWGLTYMKLTRQLSMTNYFRIENGTRVYTVESPTRVPIEHRVTMHQTALDALLDSLNADRETAHEVAR